MSRALVGLQRQWSAHQVTGIRTFTLITVLGALLGLLGHRRLLRRVSISFAVVLLSGGLLLMLWP